MAEHKHYGVKTAFISLSLGLLKQAVTFKSGRVLTSRWDQSGGEKNPVIKSELEDTTQAEKILPQLDALIDFHCDAEEDKHTRL